MRHYQKFSEPKVNTGEKYAEKYPPPVIKSMTLPLKVQTILVESYQGKDERPESLVSENSGENESGNFTNHENGIGGFRSIQPEKECHIATGELSVDKKCTQDDFERCRSPGNMIVLDPVPRPVAKHKRSKSLTNSFQKLLRREKRLGSLDGSSEEQRKPSNDNAVVSRNIEQASDRNTGYLSTPKMSLSTRRRSADDGKLELHKKPTRRKSGRFRGFFRTISLNSIADTKRNSMFASDGLLCSKCKVNEALPRKVFSVERFNSLRDERDMLKNERDRAVEEWSHAASRWEQMLDDMDTMMSELAQVRWRAMG